MKLYILILAAAFVFGSIQPIATDKVNFANPTPAPTPIATPIPTPAPTPIPTPTPASKWVGLASYYSRKGCIGCSPTLTMSNGDTLDDNARTIAFNRVALGTKLKLTHQKTGATVICEVTDRGGFERHGKIADLTIATRDALGCGDVCPIIIEALDK